MTRAQQSAYFTPAREARERPALPSARAEVDIRDLWDVVDAAKVYMRRKEMGRWDVESTRRAKDELERAFERLPAGVWVP